MGDVGCSVFGTLPKAMNDQDILTSAFIISGHYLFNKPLVTPQISYKYNTEMLE